MFDTATVTFDLERFAWSTDAFELIGRWGGDAGALGPVRLIVEIDGRPRDIAAQGNMVAAPGDGWRARFLCARAPRPGAAARLIVGGLEVELPEPEIIHWGTVERQAEVRPSEPVSGEDMIEILRSERAALEDARQRLESERHAAEQAEERLIVARRTAQRTPGQAPGPVSNVALAYLLAALLVFVFLLLVSWVV